MIIRAMIGSTVESGYAAVYLAILGAIGTAGVTSGPSVWSQGHSFSGKNEIQKTLAFLKDQALVYEEGHLRFRINFWIIFEY